MMTKRLCPLGEDCDLTVAWMAGRESAKDAYKARIDELERLTRGQAEQLEIQGNRVALLSSSGHKQSDRIEELEAKLAKAVGLLEAWIRVATHCTIEEGVCCCGAAMDTHDDPMSCGHLQVDHGAYVARGLVEETNATLAELTGGKDD